MNRPIAIVTPAARHDLERQVRWLRAEAGPETAARLAVAAIATFDKLAGTPGLGSPVAIQVGNGLHDIRKWRVDGFPNVLFFYRSAPEGILVLRVLHAASDWQAALDAD